MIALVIFTGRDTKISMNQGRYRFKQSKVEQQLNIILFINLAVILILSGIFTGRLKLFIEEEGKGMKYVYPEDTINVRSFTSRAYGTFFLLFNRAIPLAMMVVLEIIKLSYGFVVENDAQMIVLDKATGTVTQCKVQALNLYEELGQIT